MRMETKNRKLAVFLVPNGQGGFRRESYSLRKEVGSSVSSGANYTYPRFGGARRGFEGKVAKEFYSISRFDISAFDGLG